MFFRKKVKRNFAQIMLDRSTFYEKRAEAALGISGTKEAKYFEPLIYALKTDPEPSVRMNAAFALGELAMRNAKLHLLEALQEDGSEWVRSFCASAIVKLDIDFTDVEEVLITMLDKETDFGAKRHFAHSLGQIGTDKSTRILLSLLRNDLDTGVRADAAEALGMIGDKEAYEMLKKAADNDISAEVRRQAFAAYKKIEENDQLTDSPQEEQ